MATTTPLSYNPSLIPINGTTQIGSLAVGVTQQDYSTGPGNVVWWMSPDQDLGYIISYPDINGGHTGNTTSGDTTAYVGFIRTTGFTDDSFINLAQYVSQLFNTPQTFSSATQANTWLFNNGYWSSYSTIVDQGLTLNLNASDLSSYPGTGNTWYDLINPQQNITLVNSPTFTSGNTSYFSFNGSNQYGTGSGQVLQSTGYTKSVWFYLNAYVDNNLLSSNSGGHYMFFQGSNRLYSGHVNWAGFPSNYPSTATFNLNTWYNATLTFNTTDGMKLYINGVQDSSYTTIKTAFVGNGSTNLAAFDTGNLLNGRISKVYCYERSLSSTEVLRLYNATKSSFGF